jgi:hypothetical protein
VGAHVKLFALIQAAKLEGIPEERVLEAEGVSAEAWRRARTAVLSAIVTDAAVHHAYTAAQLEASQRFHRPIAPLFDDLGAWRALERTLRGDAAAPVAGRAKAGSEREGAALEAALAARGLTLGDHARLERHWRARLLQDRELARVEARTELPELVIGERAYLPDGHIERDERISLDEIDRLAGVAVAMEIEADAERAAGRYGFHSARAANDAVLRWLSARPSRDELSWHRQRVEHHRRARAERSASSAEPSSPDPRMGAGGGPRLAAGAAPLNVPPPPLIGVGLPTEEQNELGGHADPARGAERPAGARPRTTLPATLRALTELAVFAAYSAELEYFTASPAGVKQRYGLVDAQLESLIRASWQRRQRDNASLYRALTEAIYRHRWALHERGLGPGDSERADAAMGGAR